MCGVHDLPESHAIRLLVAATLCGAAPLAAQQAMNHHPPAWKEMDTFHMVMMATWHPAKGKNDLAPTRAKAGELADAAQRWAASRGPGACGDSATTAAVARVATDARALAGLAAKSAPDAELKASLAALHDRFEPLEERCGGEMAHDPSASSGPRMDGMREPAKTPSAAPAKRPSAGR